MFAKLSLVVCSLFFVSFVHSNDIRLGYVQSYSRQIYNEIKEANPALWKRTDDIVINANGNEVISAVYVTDLREYKDGEAFIESGGVGTPSVTIGLKSPSVLRGYKFLIEVYADRPNSGYFSKGGYYGDTQYSRKY